jgi:hypothetical protein
MCPAIIGDQSTGQAADRDINSAAGNIDSRSRVRSRIPFRAFPGRPDARQRGNQVSGFDGPMASLGHQPVVLDLTLS